MKILQINCVYGAGSTGKIVKANSDVLRGMGHQVYSCYGVGNSNFDEVSEKICGNIEHKSNSLLARINGIQYGGFFFSNHRFVKVIKEFKPDIVHIHCINAYMINVYQLLRYLGENNIKTVVTLHAEFFHTGGCGHSYECEKWVTKCHHCPIYRSEINSWFFDRSKTGWRRMSDAFRYFDSQMIAITAVSPWLAKRAKRSSILGRFNVEYVPNGVDTDVFKYRPNTNYIGGQSYKKNVLFVTPSFSMDEKDLKGGRYIPLIAKKHPEYRFVVVASRRDNFLGEMPSNVLLWGRAKTQEELSALYSEADVTILFSKRETFSMVTAESLCCGTPVIGFKAGGPESIALPEYSSFVEYGNIQAFSDVLDKYLNMVFNKIEISQKAILAYSKENMAYAYLKTYKKLFKTSC